MPFRETVRVAFVFAALVFVVFARFLGWGRSCVEFSFSLSLSKVEIWSLLILLAWDLSLSSYREFARTFVSSSAVLYPEPQLSAQLWVLQLPIKQGVWQLARRANSASSAVVARLGFD